MPYPPYGRDAAGPNEPLVTDDQIHYLALTQYADQIMAGVYGSSFVHPDDVVEWVRRAERARAMAEAYPGV